MALFFMQPREEESMNVPEMTIGGEKPVDTTELDNLRRENDELFAFTSRGGKWSMIKR